jgi:hypothetical protein
MRMVLGMVSLLALAACNSGSSNPAEVRVTPSEEEGGAATSEVALEGFEEVALAGPDNVEITLGEEFSVRAEGPEDVLELLEYEIHGDRLDIGRRHENFSMRGPRGVATIYITMPAIRGAAIAGSGDLTIDRAEADEFEASVAGSGNIAIGELATDSAEFDIAGSGDIRVAGIAGDVEIGIAGSGNVRADDLQAARLDVRIAGSGNVDAYVTESVDANFIGSGDVNVRGGAECRSRSIGSGDLRCS